MVSFLVDVENVENVDNAEVYSANLRTGAEVVDLLLCELTSVSTKDAVLPEDDLKQVWCFRVNNKVNTLQRRVDEILEEKRERQMWKLGIPMTSVIM